MNKEEIAQFLRDNLVLNIERESYSSTIKFRIGLKDDVEWISQVEMWVHDFQEYES